MVEGIAHPRDNDIDAHVVLTVYDTNDWMKQFIDPALKAEKNGAGVFYLDKEKATKYGALRLLAEKVSKREGGEFNGVIHNISKAGIKVKGQSETLQLKRWFGDSKVVDKDGKPLVVYHRSSEGFTDGQHRDVRREQSGYPVSTMLLSRSSKRRKGGSWNGKIHHGQAILPMTAPRRVKTVCHSPPRLII